MTLFKCSPLKITRHRDKHCSLQAPLNGRFPVLAVPPQTPAFESACDKVWSEMTTTHSFQGQMSSHSIIFLSAAGSFEVWFRSATAARCQKADVRHEQMKVYRVVIHLKETSGWGGRENKEIVPCFLKCILLSVRNRKNEKPVSYTFWYGPYHYNVNVCMNTWIRHYFKPNWH